MIAKTLWASIAIVLVAFTNAEYDVAKYCQLVEIGTKLPSLTSCQTYYLCGPGGQPLQANCTAGRVFSKNAQDCVSEANGDCYFGLANPCENKNQQFVPHVQYCNQWNYCVNGQISGSGTCPNAQIFDPSTGSCVYGSCNSNNNNNNGYTTVQNVCQIMPDGVFFGDFENCNAWHKCKAMQKQDGVCGKQLVYDAKTGQCLTNDGTMCYRTGGVVANQPGGAPDTSCTEATAVKKVGDTQVCSVYYSCEISAATGTTPATYTWVEKKCQNQYYDVITQKCASISTARPYPTCNRCQFTPPSTQWVNKVDLNCATYNTCKNGQMVSNAANKCPAGTYFNQPGQFCDNDTNLSNYSKNYGACQNYTCTDERVCTLPAIPNPPGPGGATKNI